MYLTDQNGNKRKADFRAKSQFAVYNENFTFMKHKSSDIVTLVFGILFLVIGFMFVWKYYKSRHEINPSSTQTSTPKSGKETSNYNFGFPV